MCSQNEVFDSILSEKFRIKCATLGIFISQHIDTMSSAVLAQLREELLCEVVALTPPGHRQRIRKEWQKGREGQSGISEGKRRITVDEQDKETLEIIEGSFLFLF